MRVALGICTTALVACVGDDFPPYDAGGDNTTDAPLDATGDASDADAGADAIDATYDAPADAEASCGTPHLLTAACDASSPTTCVTAQGLACVAVVADCTTGVVQCVDTSSLACGGTQPCCLSVNATRSSTCPVHVTIGADDIATACGTSGTCGSSMQVCVTDGDCNGKKCHAARFVVSSVVVDPVFGVCE
jgi:hypothetical protein